MSNTGIALWVEPKHRPARPASHADAIRHGLADVARTLHATVPAHLCTPDVRQSLKDWKDQDRSKMVETVRALDILTSVSALATSLRVRFALPEFLHATILRKAPPVALVRDEVLDGEDHANSAADVAVRRFIAYPTPANRQAAREALEAQKAHTQLCLDWLNANPMGAA